MKCPPDCTCGKHRRGRQAGAAETGRQAGEDFAQAVSHDDSPPVPAEPTEPKLIYYDQSHAYYINGKRAKGVSTISKAASDDYNIRMWSERMIGIGLATEPEGRNLRENIAAHVDDKQTVNDICEQAKKVAQAHLKADRGTQKHRVLELILLDQEHLLITDQQRADAEILKRTMDRYKLTPVGDLTEQFVCYTREDIGAITGYDDPGFSLAGRFDAVLDFENAEGIRVLVDLKSGINAVKYPHTTLCQLSLYTNAPRISFGNRHGSFKCEITEWSTMPDDLNHDVAYVLLVENDGKVGTLHELDIQHGWRSAVHTLSINAWRKQLDESRGAVREVPFDPFIEKVRGPKTLAQLINEAGTRTALRTIWKIAKSEGLLTDAVQETLKVRADGIQDAAS